MAKSIATITLTALRPGVSKNNRWYKPEHVAGAVLKAQQRLAAGEKPMVMLTHHEAGDDSKEIAASLTSASLAEDGSAKCVANIADTPAGWNIANLADTSDGQPAHLRNVSIRGAWTGRVRKERGPGGQMVETADGLELDGVDFTKAPGVDGAEITAFSWAADGQNETAERVLITESVEGTVTVSETAGTSPGQETGTAPAPEGVLEAVRAILAPAEVHEFSDGLCSTCAGVEEKGSNAPYGNVPYADPGYLDASGNQASKSGKPGVKRYPLDKKHVRAAWSYVNQAKNAAQYTAAQLKRIKGRIKAAMRSIGATVAAEAAGWTFDAPFEVTESIQEWYGDSPKRSGSWSVSASNGPVSMSMSSYSMDPADLGVILRAAAAAAGKALATLDPDMDGDVDVDGAGSSDTDGDGGSGESAPAEDEPADAGETGPAPAGTEEGDPAMAEGTSTTESGGAEKSGLTLEAVQETAAKAAAAAVEAAFAARDKARKDAKKAARKAEEKAAAKGGKTTTETGEGGTTETSGSDPAAEEKARIDAAVAEALKAAGVQPKVEETEEQAISRKVKEAVQGLVAEGAITVNRVGLIEEHAAPTADTAKTADELAAMSDDDFQAYGGSALDVYLGQNSTRIHPVHTSS